MPGPNDFNDKIIAEFHANAGVVGGPFADMPLLLLHSTGAKSGEARVNPVAYQALDNGSYAVFASRGGAPVNPGWYHNVIVHPQVEAEIGTGRSPFTARVAAGDERERIWQAQKAANHRFVEYEQKTSRQIPVIVLDPR
jgi:deazaflavin-dependent oxidoreductase (nitroreductase family)